MTELMRDLIMTCTASSVAELVTLPLDTIRINVQNNQIRPKQAIKNIYNDLGVMGFYRSVIPSVLRSGSSTGIRLGLYQYMLKHNEMNISKPILGGICGLTSQLISMPFDVIKSQIQGQIGITAKNQLTMSYRLKHIWSNYGIKGFYKGYWQIAQRSCIISSIQGPLYFTLHDEILPNNIFVNDFLNYWKLSATYSYHSISAILTTLTVTSVVYPIDLCKTIAMNNYNKYSSYHIIKELINNNGISSIYRGITISFIRALPHFWLTTAILQSLKSL